MKRRVEEDIRGKKMNEIKKCFMEKSLKRRLSEIQKEEWRKEKNTGVFWREGKDKVVEGFVKASALVD